MKEFERGREFSIQGPFFYFIFRGKKKRTEKKCTFLPGGHILRSRKREKRFAWQEKKRAAFAIGKKDAGQ